MLVENKPRPAAFRRILPFALAAALAALPPAQAGSEVLDLKTGHLLVAETDLTVPAAGILLELRRVASSADEGGGILGPRWRLSVDRRVPASPSETIRDFDSGREFYRPDGKLSRVEMRNRGAVTLSYDASGRLTAISGPAGAAIRLTLNPAGRLVRAETTDGAVAEYRYLNGLLSEVQVRGRAPSRYLYDSLRRISRIDDAASGPTQITYDPKHRVLQRRFASGVTESIAFDDARNEMRITGPSGGVTTITRSADGRQETSIDPAGRRTVIDYDPQNRPVRLAVDGGEPVLTGYDHLNRIAATGAAGKQLRYEYLGDTPLPTSITFPDGSRHLYSYDPNQQLLAIREGDETLLQITYTPGGLPASLRKRGQPELRYSYRPDGRLASESDSTGRIWQYDYDTRGNLTRERFNGRLTSYEYDAQDRLVAITDPAGAVTRYTLDSAGRRTRVTDALGGSTQFEYDSSGRLILETDPAGRSTRYRYDAAGLVAGITYPGGATRSYVYGRAGNLLREVNPAGGATRYDYDPSGRLARVTDPVERVWTYEYSAPTQVGKVVDPDGRATEVLYDQQRRRIGWTSDAGSTVRLERDGQGRVAAIRFPGGLTRTVTYDAAGRPVAEETNLTPREQRVFDDAGRLTMIRNSTGAQTTFRYDASGVLAEVKESSGASLAYEYDARGLRTAARDAQGSLARFSYDLLGRLTQVTGPGSGSRRLNYNAAGDLERVQEANGDAVQLSYGADRQLLRVVAPSGAATHFERDAFGNPTKVSGPLGAETRFTYDAAGRLLSETDHTGGVRSYQYDAAGRISEKILPGGRRVKYLYDQAGRQSAVDDGVFPVRYGYDAAGRRNSIEYPALRASLGYEYDSAGRLVKFRAPGGREIGYSYDAHKRLSAIALPGGKAIQFEYDPAGLLAAIAYPNGVRGAWQRAPSGRLLKVAYTDASGKVLDGSSYDYDPAGQVAKMLRANGTGAEYRYDASGQLVEESTGASSVRYSYLPGGDRALRDASGQTTAYKYNEAGQLVEAGAEVLSYDPRGNQARKGAPAGAASYSWDAMNRLERVVLADASQIRYGYSYSGERLWREDAQGRTWFLTDGVNLIADLDASFQVRTLYVHAPGIDRPLAAIDSSGFAFFHTNALGSVTSLTNSLGQVAASYTYDAFGVPVGIEGKSPNRLLHAAREYDSDTGLYYVRARYYDPRLGRFLSPDPLWPDWSDPLSLNRYAYVRNAPTRNVDLSGERVFPTAADIWTAWELAPAQWADIQKAAKDFYFWGDKLLEGTPDAPPPPDPEKVWAYAEAHTADDSTKLSGTKDPLGNPQTRTVKGQELYENVMQDLERRTKRIWDRRQQLEEEGLRRAAEARARAQAQAASNQPQPGPAAEARPGLITGEGPPSNPSPEQRAAAARGTAPQPQPESGQPAAAHEPLGQTAMHDNAPRPRGDTVRSMPARPRSTFAPQSRVPTLEIDGRHLTGAALLALGTATSIATDVEEGRDIGQSVKEHSLAAAVSTAVGGGLYYVSTGAGALAGVATAAGTVLGPVGVAALAYGVYRYGTAVANRPEREADSRLQQQREVNAGLAGQSLSALRDLVASELTELNSLQTRYNAASASITANAASIRQSASRIQGLLASLRTAVQSPGPAASASSQLKSWEESLAGKVRQANSLAEACATEADAAGALAAYNEAVGLAGQIVSQADAARSAPAPATANAAALRDTIVGDAAGIVSMQSRLAADWSSLPAIKAQFDSRRQALLSRIPRARSALPPDLTPAQQNLFDQLTAQVQSTRFAERPTDLSESPEAIQNIAGEAVQAKLDAQDLAARAETAASKETPAEASAANSVILLASAEGVPAKAQACRERLANASQGFVSLGGENKSNNEDTKPQQKDTPPPATPQGAPGLPQPDTELLSRNSVRQAMENASAQADRLKLDAQAQLERQAMEQQQAAPQPPRRPGFLETLTTMMGAYSALQTGMNSPAGFQSPQLAQYYSNMYDTFRQQNGGKGPSSEQLTSLLSTIQRLRSQEGGGQSSNPQQPQQWVSSLSQVMGQQNQQQPSFYEQQTRLIAQGLGARSSQQPAQPQQQTTVQQPTQQQPTQQRPTPQQKTQPQPTQPKPQPQPANPTAPAAQPAKPTAPAAQPSPQPAEKRELSCSQKFCPQCIAGKMGEGVYASMSCQTCEWARRQDIVPCNCAREKSRYCESYGFEMCLYCVTPRDKATGKCSVLKMEWSDMKPQRDPNWYSACTTTAIGCKGLIETIKSRGYDDYDRKKWEGVTFIMPQGW